MPHVSWAGQSTPQIQFSLKSQCHRCCTNWISRIVHQLFKLVHRAFHSKTVQQIAPLVPLAHQSPCKLLRKWLTEVWLLGYGEILGIVTFNLHSNHVSSLQRTQSCCRCRLSLYRNVPTIKQELSPARYFPNILVNSPWAWHMPPRPTLLVNLNSGYP